MGITLSGILEACNACMHAKSLQSSPTPCDPVDSSPPGSCVHRTLQVRTLEWVAISFSTEVCNKPAFFVRICYTLFYDLSFKESHIAGRFDLMRAVCAFLSQESPCLTREKSKVSMKSTIRYLGKAADTFTGSLIVNKTEKGSKEKNQSSVRFSTVQYKSRLSKDYFVKLPNRLSQALS